MASMLLFTTFDSGSDIFGQRARGYQTMNQEKEPTVLVVDDDQDHNRALAKIFERAGYRVRTAEDGREALMVLTERPYDLIITDLKMPHMNGLDLLRSIRAMSADMPVVILTAFGEWETYIDAMNCGCVDYLSKPVRRDDILLTARKALARRGVRPPEIARVTSAEGEDTAS
jgi:DNA-binding NtrC family response regulator